MKKADYEFHKDRKRQIELKERQTEPGLVFYRESANSPIHFPKRKKKK